eukprot:TRINITY_DN7820_c0_g1_i1.p1 TRINITY_DN7820_c0_g1~~TRINITY_DN7820_c0_g1_i1.p1  ORF type:complete len:440 (+),score=38.74 TRINITY_DN7820_c0_g1_i1:29-1348(+)
MQHSTMPPHSRGMYKHGDERGPVSSRKVYVGLISPLTREEDILGIFGRYGKIIECVVKRGYAFIDYDTSREASAAIASLDGYYFHGSNLIVQYALGQKRFTVPRGKYRLYVEGLPPGMTWRELKDVFRQIGNVVYTEVYNDHGNNKGMVEFQTRRDLDNAISEMKRSKKKIENSEAGRDSRRPSDFSFSVSSGVKRDRENEQNSRSPKRRRRSESRERYSRHSTSSGTSTYPIDSTHSRSKERSARRESTSRTSSRKLSQLPPERRHSSGTTSSSSNNVALPSVKKEVTEDHDPESSSLSRTNVGSDHQTTGSPVRRSTGSQSLEGDTHHKNDGATNVRSNQASAEMLELLAQKYGKLEQELQKVQKQFQDLLEDKQKQNEKYSKLKEKFAAHNNELAELQRDLTQKVDENRNVIESNRKELSSQIESTREMLLKILVK